MQLCALVKPNAKKSDTKAGSPAHLYLLPAFKHASGANGTVPFQAMCNALMFPYRHADTGIALHAVPKINAQALTEATYVAVGTMINVLVRRIVVKVAYITIVAGKGSERSLVLFLRL